ncbi:hypothetical protein MpV1_003c [Micromonas sp. RCC1109 virus MpV1]|uniref:hypothetical protein n=1 Tax=Micromonas sp. RCC1109 virus MpV1 TaxID=880161 RepID=UPI0001EF441F|nr:hypothetical protein MpV1_003c [Micromonas sp. RCC1109 virus MpV1]ADQ90926.1 hypothetical protein MpV1_003c [Micromonas sp. RCC1109 virus MpV1]
MSYRTNSSNNSMAIINLVIIMLVMSSVFSVIGGGAWFLLQPQESDSCEGDDKNGKYEIDEDGDCTFMECKDGYAMYNGVCTEDKSGIDCVNEDVNPRGIYKTNIPGECTFVTCESGYELNTDGICEIVSIEGDTSNVASTDNDTPASTDNDTPASTGSDTPPPTSSGGYNAPPPTSSGGYNAPAASVEGWVDCEDYDPSCSKYGCERDFEGDCLGTFSGVCTEYGLQGPNSSGDCYR